MHPQCETCRGLRRVRSALQESDPLIYRVLIRLPLWRFDQAKDEISPSFCVCVSPPRNPASLLYPSLAPFTTTPCTRVMMPFVGTRALALHCYWGSTAGFVFYKLRADCRRDSSWTVSFLSVHHAFLQQTLVSYLRPLFLFCTQSITRLQCAALICV